MKQKPQCRWCLGSGELGPPEDSYVCPCENGKRPIEKEVEGRG